jgi:hypothetical protein
VKPAESEGSEFVLVVKVWRGVNITTVFLDDPVMVLVEADWSEAIVLVKVVYA